MTISSPLAETNLFNPITIGDDVKLSHRIVIPPLTRNRGTEDHIPTNLILQHYDDLTKTPGSLVITEAIFVALKAAGWNSVPGIWNDRQIKAWKQITDKVHENGSYLSIQLWSMGRQAIIEEITREGIPYKSASDGLYIKKEDKELAEKFNNPLTALTREEIKEYVQTYATVSERAIKEAGFDIIEIHGAGGYLFDQFFQSVSNKRTDEYGGSIENRARFFFEVLDAIIEKIGGNKVAVRISPWATFGGMAGAHGDPHPYATFGYIFSEIEKRRKQHGFAYLSVIEPRVSGSVTVKLEDQEGQNEWIYDIFKGPILRCGNYYEVEKPGNVTNAIKDVQKNDRTLIGFGRISTSNPDIVERLRHGYELRPYERDFFYTRGNHGYNTYSRYGEKLNLSEEEKHKEGTPLA